MIGICLLMVPTSFTSLTDVDESSRCSESIHPIGAWKVVPATLENIVDQTVSHVLDLLGGELDHDSLPRWQEPLAKPLLQSAAEKQLQLRHGPSESES
jgi:3-polyprenyl-4-hydroxybenzoate decarboxylase